MFGNQPAEFAHTGESFGKRRGGPAGLRCARGGHGGTGERFRAAAVHSRGTNVRVLGRRVHEMDLDFRPSIVAAVEKMPAFSALDFTDWSRRPLRRSEIGRAHV